MKILRFVLAGLILTAATDAFARGGPGGALGAVLEWFLVLAIVVGLVSGALCSRFMRPAYWKALAALFAVLAAVVCLVPFFGVLFFGIFFGIPAVVLFAVFASVAYLVRGGLFQPRPVAPPRTSVDGELQESKIGGMSNILRWIAGTYLFWVVVSLANFELLGFLAIPPLVVFFPGTIGRVLPFVLPPLAVAVSMAAVVTVFAIKRRHVNHHAAPFVFNVCVLLMFFAAAELYRYHLMSQSLRDHKPDSLESSSFLGSVLGYRTYFRGPHASFNENGKLYRWSYSERKFVQVQ